MSFLLSHLGIAVGAACDELPDGRGTFGSVTNPIPVNGPIGQTVYLNRLRTPSGAGFYYHRLGSACSPATRHPVDHFEMLAIDGSCGWELFFDIYNPRRSQKVPPGLKRDSWADLSSPERAMIKLDYHGSKARVPDFPFGLPDVIEQSPQLRSGSASGRVLAMIMRPMLAGWSHLCAGGGRETIARIVEYEKLRAKAANLPSSGSAAPSPSQGVATAGRSVTSEAARPMSAFQTGEPVMRHRPQGRVTVLDPQECMRRFHAIREAGQATSNSLQFDPAAPPEYSGDPAERKYGWWRCLSDLTPIVTAAGFRLREGSVLRSYLFRDGRGNGRSIVYAMRRGARFLQPWECMRPLDKERQEDPIPPAAMPSIMEVLEGNGDGVSYLAASLLEREIAEVGAAWHGLNWQMQHLICRDPRVCLAAQSPEKWEWLHTPSQWAPTLCHTPDGFTVTFYSYTILYGERIERHTDHFPDGYRFSSEKQVIARGKAEMLW